METNRITSEEFITIIQDAGNKMSTATLSRRLKDDDFIDAVGAKKEMTETSKIPAWTFDRELSAEFAKPKQTAMVKSVRNLPDRKQTAQKVITHEQSELDFFQVIKNSFLLPAKIYLTLDEAKLLTGFPKSELHKFSELKFGRRVIKKSELEKI